MYSYRIAMISRLLSVLLIGAISNSSVQGSASYSAKAIAEGESTCPSGEDHETLLTVMDTEIDYLLKSVVDTVSPCTDAFLGMTENCPARSCNEIFSKSRELRPSGLYWLSARNGTVVQVYCYMNMECCGTVGGWYRIAWLNLSDAFHSCPYGWRYINSPRSCGRSSSDHETVTFSSRGLNYSRVCGTVIGYQQGTPDAFSYSDSHIATVNIDQNYVDGVSVTYTPRLNRVHIWTFAAGLANSIDYRGSRSCPCSNTGNSYETKIPAFVGNDYFCEAGNETNDPVWDGLTCIVSSTCCNFNNPPRFCRELPEPTCADIEVRLMADEATSNEDVPIRLIELYVQ